MFGIIESWLGPDVDDHVIHLPGFSVMRQNRNINGGSGSVCTQSFKIKKLASSNTLGPGRPEIPEYLFCSVQQGDSPPILVGVIYRPPKIAMQKNSEFFDVLRDLCPEFSHKIIMGDLNANLAAKPLKADAITIKRLAKELSFRIVNHGPTHHKRDSHTWIDLIITDKSDTVLNYNNEWLPSFGRHAVIDITLDIFQPASAREAFSFRNYSKICPISFNDLLSCCDWTAMDTIETDLEGALNSLYNNLHLTIDELAPLKKIIPRKNRAPWIGSELRELIDKRNATHRRYKRTGNATLFDEFLRLTRR